MIAKQNSLRKSFRLMTWLASVLLAVPVAQAATSGADQAGNYTSATFVNGSNQGTGFGAWAFNVGAGAFVGLTNSTVGSGNINSTNNLAFCFYGGASSTYGEATRDFNAALGAGDEFSVAFAVNWDGGNRGVNILNASGNELLNINFSSGNNLTYAFTNQPGITLNTSYVSTSVVQLVVKQLAGNQLQVTLNRNDGYATNFTSGSLGSAASKVKFYNGGHTADNLNYALFVNNLQLTEAPSIALSGREGMVVAYTNLLTVRRAGATTGTLDVALSNSDTNVVQVPTNVVLGIGQASASVEVVGLKHGEATITAQAAGFADATFGIDVYNVAYDSTAYYAPGTFTNDANSGVGFQAWSFYSSLTNGVGYTNYAGQFVGDSTQYGGGNVNSSSNNAFGLYANKAGVGGPAPQSEASRSFATLQIGDTLSVDLGVNFRNGAKGVMIQNGNDWLFNVEVSGDNYVYQNYATGGAQTSLGWTNYAANTAIRLDLTRVGNDAYNVVITRSGQYSESVQLNGISLGNKIPARARFYVYDTQAGGENNLYFNKLAIDRDNVLAVSGIVNVNVGGTRQLTVTRDGATNNALVVALASGNAGVATVQPSVTINAGDLSATFSVTGVTAGLVQVQASATDYVAAPFTVDVFSFPAEWDNAGNYLDTTFTNGANGGAGFGAWNFSALTNLATIQLRDARLASGDINSANTRSFAIYGGTNSDYASADRTFTALSAGDTFEVVLAMNYSGGNRGIDLKDASGNNLVNFNLGSDVYTATLGGNPGTSLGWSYSSTSVVSIVAEQLAGNQLKVTLTRNDGLTTNYTTTGLTAPLAKLNLYNGGHDGADVKQALYANDLLITRAALTDGIPNSWWDHYNVPGTNRVAAQDSDSDGVANQFEYIADTSPLDNTRYFLDKVTTLSGQSVLNLQVGPSTTNSRLYDVWWSTNLLASPQVWTAFGLNVAGAAGGGSLNLTVTNDVQPRYYRTGVKLP